MATVWLVVAWMIYAGLAALVALTLPLPSILEHLTNRARIFVFRAILGAPLLDIAFVSLRLVDVLLLVYCGLVATEMRLVANVSRIMWKSLSL